MDLIVKWVLRVSIGLLLSPVVLAHPADEIIRESALKIMKEAREANNGDGSRKQEAIKFARGEAKKIFDYENMTRLVLGKNWRQATVDQQARLTVEMESMLSRMYAGSLFALADAKVTIREAQERSGEANVRMDLIRPGASATRIDYGLRKKDGCKEGGQSVGCWLVYDVSIEGVSLVSSQRSIFAELVGKEGIEGLIEALEKRSKVQEKQEQKAAKN